jgi:hypothetical protein
MSIDIKRGKIMNIDYSKTLSAYLGYEGKMEHLTRVVHEYVLSDQYLGKKGKAKQIWKGVGKIADINKELLIQSFVPKLRFKLPALHLDEQFDAFETERAKLIAAGIVTNVLVDSGYFTVREDICVIPVKTVNGHKKFKKFLYLQLGGEPLKDLYKGINLDPGVVNQSSVCGRSLTAEQRFHLSEVASVPYKIWDGCTTELLMHGYGLKSDWHKKHWVDADGKKRRLSEDPIVKKRRFAVYADKIVNHVKKFPKFFLSMKYDHRYREYYEAATLAGMCPHGKLWETLMIDSAEPFDLTEDDREVLKHIIYVNIHGRTTMANALKAFTVEDLFYAESVDPMTATTEKEFGRLLLLHKASIALKQYADGEQSTFMFGYDFTNSGLMMAGLSFHSKEMMKSANLGNHKTVHDSHTDFGKGYGLDLDRDTVKEVHTPLLHGSSIKTLVKILNSHLGEGAVDEAKVSEANEKAYGLCVRNIGTIADWGALVTGNRQSILRWTMPDSYKAASRAHMEGVPIECYAASARHKEGYCLYVVVSNMPLVEDNNGYPIYDKNTQLDGVSYPVKVHKRGLFADLTHSIDAYVLRCVVRALRAAGMPFLLKHDDYIVPPRAMHIVKAAAQEAFNELYKVNMYSEALKEIAEFSPYNPGIPTLYMGDARNTAGVSENFLMP